MTDDEYEYLGDEYPERFQVEHCSCIYHAPEMHDTQGCRIHGCDCRARWVEYAAPDE